jgi:hypothetical protein
MRIYLAALLYSAALLRHADAGIDFTPTGGERTLEGVVFKQILFHQDGHTISYEQPRGWTYTGEASGMKLSPPNLSQAQALMEQAPLSAPQNFDEATAKQLQQQVLASVPNGAQNIALISEEKNPLRVNRQETYEVTVGYNFFGQDYELSVLFVNLPDTQMRFRTVARKPDFEKVHREFRASLFSLSWQ